MRRQEELRRLEELRNQELQRRKQIEMRCAPSRPNLTFYAIIIVISYLLNGRSVSEGTKRRGGGGRRR